MDVVLAGQWGTPIPTNTDPAEYDGPLGTNRLSNPAYPVWVPSTNEVWFVDFGYYNSFSGSPAPRSGALRVLTLGYKNNQHLPVETIWEGDHPPAWTGSTADYDRIDSICWDPWGEQILVYVDVVVDATQNTTQTNKVYAYDPVTRERTQVASNVYPMTLIAVTGQNASAKYYWGARIGPGTFVTDTLVVYDSSWSLVGTWAVTNFERITGISHSPGHGQMVTFKDGLDFDVWPINASAVGDLLQSDTFVGGSGNTGFRDTSRGSLIADATTGHMVIGDSTANDNGGILERLSSSPGGVLAAAFPYSESTYFNTPLADTNQGRVLHTYNTTFNNTADQNFITEQGRGINGGAPSFCWIGNDPDLSPDLMGRENGHLLVCTGSHYMALIHRQGFESGFIQQMSLNNA